MDTRNQSSVFLGEIADKVGLFHRPISIFDVAKKIGYTKRPIVLTELNLAVDEYIKSNSTNSTHSA